MEGNTIQLNTGLFDAQVAQMRKRQEEERMRALRETKEEKEKRERTLSRVRLYERYESARRGAVRLVADCTRCVAVIVGACIVGLLIVLLAAYIILSATELFSGGAAYTMHLKHLPESSSALLEDAQMGPIFEKTDCQITEKAFSSSLERIDCEEDVVRDEVIPAGNTDMMRDLSKEMDGLMEELRAKPKVEGFMSAKDENGVLYTYVYTPETE